MYVKLFLDSFSFSLTYLLIEGWNKKLHGKSQFDATSKRLTSRQEK